MLKCPQNEVPNMHAHFTGLEAASLHADAIAVLSIAEMLRQY